jgi:hypothetical protein
LKNDKKKFEKKSFVLTVQEVRERGAGRPTALPQEGSTPDSGIKFFPDIPYPAVFNLILTVSSPSDWSDRYGTVLTPHRPPPVGVGVSGSLILNLTCILKLTIKTILTVLILS